MAFNIDLDDADEAALDRAWKRIDAQDLLAPKGRKAKQTPAPKKGGAKDAPAGKDEQEKDQ